MELLKEGKVEAAIHLTERALKEMERALGPEDPNVGVTLGILATMYLLKKDYAPAEPLFRRSLEVLERVLEPNDPVIATVLNPYANLHSRKRDYARAEELFRRALSIRERALGADHPETAGTLHDLASLYVNTGRHLDAEPLFERALRIREQAPGIDPMDVANTLSGLAGVYHKKGDNARAEPMLKRVVEAAEQAQDGDPRSFAAALTNLADLYREKGDYGRAEPLLQRALTKLEQVGDADDPDYAYTLNHLALLYGDKGENERAEEIFGRALQTLERALGADHPRVADVLNNLAGLYEGKGNYARAEQMLERSFKIRVKSLGITHPLVGESLDNLALFYMNRGDYRYARDFGARAAEIYERAYGADSPEVAVSLSHLARLHTNERDYARAEPLLLRTLGIYERAFGVEHPHVAYALEGLGYLYRLKGDYARAERMYQRALKIRERVSGADALSVASVIYELGLVCHEMGDYARAGALYRRALETYDRELGALHAGDANLLHFFGLLSEIQGDIAQAIRLQARATEAREHGLAVGLSFGSEYQKLSLISEYHRERDAAISLHTLSAPDNPQAARLALTVLLRHKGRALDAMADQISAMRQRLDPEGRALLNELSSARSRLASLTLRGAGTTNPEQHSERVMQLAIKAELLEKQVSARSAEFRAQLEPATLERVQSNIPAGAALVEVISYEPYNAKALARTEKWGRPRYAAYVLRGEGAPSFVDLGEAARINEAGMQVRAALADPRSAVYKQAARALDELVMRPVRQLLGETRTVLLCPDGALNLVPFGALIDEQGRYLVESYTISYLTSGRDLLRLGTKTGERQQPVVIANPAFDLAVTTAGRKAEEGGARGRRSIDFNNAEIKQLPGTAQEAAAIKGLMPAARVLTEGAATEAALKQVAGPRVLHIATHGFFLKDQPPRAVMPSRELVMDKAPQAPAGENPLLRSGLVLAGVKKGQSGAGEDGVLTALEAAGLDLWGTKLVVLSACETGVGDVANGEGIYGLRRALVLAGAESQVMSLWKVSDAATKDLMVEYYRRLQAGEGRAAALRAAQLNMLAGNGRGKQAAGRESVTGAGPGKTADYSHPFYWASFIPVGDWQGITEAAQPLAEAPRPSTAPKPREGSNVPDMAPRPALPPQAGAFRDAAERNPRSFEAQMRAASGLIQLGNTNDAVRYLERGLALRPNDAGALASMGDVKYGLGDFHAAASFYGRALAVRPDDATVRARLGDTHFSQKPPDYERAIAEYRKALAIDPKHEKAWHGIAAAALRKGSMLVARDAINQLTAINPSNPSLSGLRSELERLHPYVPPRRNR